MGEIAPGRVHANSARIGAARLAGNGAPRGRMALEILRSRFLSGRGLHGRAFRGEEKGRDKEAGRYIHLCE